MTLDPDWRSEPTRGLYILMSTFPPLFLSLMVIHLFVISLFIYLRHLIASVHCHFRIVCLEEEVAVVYYYSCFSNQPFVVAGFVIVLM